MLEIVEQFLRDRVKNLWFLVDRKNWEMIYLSQDHKPSVES